MQLLSIKGKLQIKITKMTKDVEKALKKAIRQLSQKDLVYDGENKNAWYYPNKYSYPHLHIQNQYVGTDSFRLVYNDKCINQKQFISFIDSILPNKKESIDVIRVLIRAYQLLFGKLPNCKNLKFYKSQNYPDFQEELRKKQEIYNTKKAEQIINVVAQTALEKLQKIKKYSSYAKGALQLMEGFRVEHQSSDALQYFAIKVTEQLKRLGVGQDGYYLQQALSLAQQFLKKDPVRFMKINNEFDKDD